MAKRTTRKAAGRKRVSRRKTTSKKTTQSKARRSEKNGTLSSLSLDALQTELARRQRQIGTLERKRDRLASQLEEVEQELAELGALGGVTVDGVRKRPKNDASLADSLAKVLKSKTMSVTEVADAVRQAGYRTSAENFRTIVNQTLIKDKRFKKVARGQYTAR